MLFYFTHLKKKFTRKWIFSAIAENQIWQQVSGLTSLTFDHEKIGEPMMFIVFQSDVVSWILYTTFTQLTTNFKMIYYPLIKRSQ